MSTDKNLELLRKYIETNDEYYLETLIKNYSGLIYKIHKKYKSDIIEDEDLTQILNVGLIKGLKNYEEDLSQDLTNHLYNSVNYEILTYLKQNNNLMKCSLEVKTFNGKILRYKEEYYKLNGKYPTNNEIQKHFKINYKKLVHYMGIDTHYLSLNDYKNEDTKDESKTEFIDDVRSDYSFNKNIEDKIIIKNFFNKIDDKEAKTVLYLRYIKGYNTSEISKILKMDSVDCEKIRKRGVRAFKMYYTENRIPHKALTQQQRQYVTLNGEIKTLSEWCKIYNVKRRTAVTRLRAKYTPEETFIYQRRISV